MFTLVLIDDDIPICPSDFRYEYKAELKRQIQKKYVDRVIPNVGLCIEFYDFVKIKDAHIYPGDGKMACGEAHFKVEFRLIIFKPFVDEWLVGSITSSFQSGLKVSLGFFEEVIIPCSNLRTHYTFDAVRRTWVWQYRNQETRETINFFYEDHELIRFRVASVKFPSAAGPTDKVREAPMMIIGAVDRDGLGCVNWWPDCSHFDEMLKTEDAAPPEDEMSGPAAASSHAGDGIGAPV
mmetsp:Transcript_361/g.259  ORF Transcript_361/g.259 Transcript_361/m.259 type:complete len:237 (+) Transcript_361:86-796(+)